MKFGWMNRLWKVTGIIILFIIVFLVLFIAMPNKVKSPDKIQPQTNVPSVPTNQKTSRTASLLTNISHIFVIVEENNTYASIVNSPNAPYINRLARQYALATNYSAVAHPSLPNYIALTSGSTNGVTTDCNPPTAGCEVDVTNIADRIEQSGRTWKEYAESMPRNCYFYNSGNYATKHNPFVYYTDIVNNVTRCTQHVVPFTQLANDLKSTSTTPNYAFITPNLCNDMHNCSVATGDKWLAKYVPMILQSPAFTKQNSILIITWDEGNITDNHVATILAGNAIKTGYQSAKPYNHYSILRTIEYLWKLQPLTNNDKSAQVMTEFIR